jgi:hypothetical protein
MSTQQNVQNKQNTITKPCDRCQEPIQWNNTIRKFESVEFPGYQHACKQGCNTDGCTNPVYFSNQCPKNPATGRSRPLGYPIPIKDGAGKLNWMLHTHSTDQDQTVKLLPFGDTTIPGGQQTLGEVKAQVANPYIAASKTDTKVAVNKDYNDTLVQAVNDMNQRIGKIEEYLDKILVPDHRDLMTYFEAIRKPLDIIAGAIAKESFTSAKDILIHNQDKAAANVQSSS